MAQNLLLRSCHLILNAYGAFAILVCQGKGVKEMKNLLKRLNREEKGQGLVEYTLITLLVALVFWVAVKNTNIGEQLTTSWGKVKTCLEDPQGAGCGK